MRYQRPFWHERSRCDCDCIYCDYDGCDHGHKCYKDYGYSCSRCFRHTCPTLETAVHPCSYKITRYMPFTIGTYKSQRPVVFTFRSSRLQMLTKFFEAVDSFKPHHDFSAFHKTMMKLLLSDFPQHILICRWDFIQNIVVKRGTEIAQTYYSRKQIGFLVCTVYFRNRVGETVKHFYEFFMDYLKHSSLVFHECMDLFVENFPFPDYITTIILLSDGAGKEFRSRHNLIWGAYFKRKYGYTLRMCVDPPYHGKGECDSRGGVIKRGLLRHIVKPGCHVDTVQHLVRFVNNCMHRKYGGEAYFVPIHIRMTEVLGKKMDGIYSHYDYIFNRTRTFMHWRKYSCFCNACLHGAYDQCINTVMCGPLIRRRVQREGRRHPSEVTLSATARQPQFYAPNVNVGYNARNYQWEVYSIVSKRTSDESIEYLVNWVNWDTPTWMAEADLQGSQDLLTAFNAQFDLPNAPLVPDISDSDSASDVDSSSSVLAPQFAHNAGAIHNAVVCPRFQVEEDEDSEDVARAHDSSSVHQEEEPEFWEVEQILLVRTTPDDTSEYFVSWVGWADSFNSWVAERDLSCATLIAAFKRANQ